MRFTDLSIRALDADGKRRRAVFDDTFPNFGMSVSYGGTRTWIVVVGPEKRRRWVSLGHYPQVSLKEARKLAHKHLHEPPRPKKSTAFIEAFEQFLGERSKTLSGRTIDDYRGTILRHFPLVKAALSNISSADIRRAISAIDGKPAEQRHLHAYLRTFFNWAVRNDVIDVNPLSKVDPPETQRSRSRVLDHSEIGEVYRASIAHPFPFGPIVRLLLLTGQRRGEIGRLEWSWIDFEDRTITFPPEAVKNRTTHAIPLEDAAASILQTLPRLNQFVFPARGTKDGKPAPFSGWSKSKEPFDHRLTAVEPYTLHDLRRTFASQLAMLGTPIHVTEKLLNHRSGSISGVAAIYNRYDYMDEQRQALRALETHLAKLAEF